MFTKSLKRSPDDDVEDDNREREASCAAVGNDDGDKSRSEVSDRLDIPLKS